MTRRYCSLSHISCSLISIGLVVACLAIDIVTLGRSLLGPAHEEPAAELRYLALHTCGPSLSLSLGV